MRSVHWGIKVRCAAFHQLGCEATFSQRTTMLSHLKGQHADLFETLKSASSILMEVATPPQPVE